MSTIQNKSVLLNFLKIELFQSSNLQLYNVRQWVQDYDNLHSSNLESTLDSGIYGDTDRQCLVRIVANGLIELRKDEE